MKIVKIILHATARFECSAPDLPPRIYEGVDARTARRRYQAEFHKFGLTKDEILVQGSRWECSATWADFCIYEGVDAETAKKMYRADYNLPDTTEIFVQEAPHP